MKRSQGQDPEGAAREIALRGRLVGFLLAVVLVQAGATWCARGRRIPEQVQPASVSLYGSQANRIPLHVPDKAESEAEAVGTALLWCRERRATEVCMKRGSGDGDCWAAREAVLADGIFTRLKGLRGDRGEQKRVAAEALNRCMGIGEDPELQRYLGMQVEDLKGGGEAR